MMTQKFALEIEHLLVTGVIQDLSILKLYRLLKAYEQGNLDSVVMQRAIDQYNPDK